MLIEVIALQCYLLLCFSVSFDLKRLPRNESDSGVIYFNFLGHFFPEYVVGLEILSLIEGVYELTRNQQVFWEILINSLKFYEVLENHGEFWKIVVNFGKSW